MDTNVASELMRPYPEAAVEADCQIAAMARSRGMTVVTRNVSDFVDMELELVNPWQVP